MTTPTGQTFGDKYRVLTKDQLAETLLLEGHAYCSDMDAARDEIGKALGQWVKGGLPYRESGQAVLFDPVEVVSFVKAAGLRGEDDYWESRLVPTLRRFVADLETSPPDKVTAHYSRTFNMSDCASGEKKRLRMPLPLAARHAHLSINPQLPQQATGHRVSDGRLEARVATDSAGDIILGVEVQFEARGQRDEAAPDSDIYLKDKEGLVVITPAVQSLANRLAGDQEPEAAVRSFWEYLIEGFTFCPVHYDQIPPDSPLDWVIERKVYDCQLASALFVALCRARGIHGRLVGGHFLYAKSPTNHFWAEIWLENSGWTPFDFIGWDLSLGGRDSVWRDRFYGQMEPRMITECLPRSFTGAIGMAVPDAWLILRSICGAGVNLRLTGLDGKPVYTDHVTIR